MNTRNLAIIAAFVLGIVTTSTVAACLPDTPPAESCPFGQEGQYLSNAENETVLVCGEPDAPRPGKPNLPAPVTPSPAPSNPADDDACRVPE